MKSTRDHLFTIRCMERDYSSGQMVEFTTATLILARRAAKAYTSGPTVKFTTENLRKITAPVLEFFTIPMERDLKEHGGMGRSTEKAFTFGRQVRSTTAFIWTAIRKTKVSWTILQFLSMNSNKTTAAFQSDCKLPSRLKSKPDAFN